jgi:hypothetical protein
MNIEATIEDLEAQGYFQSQTKPIKQTNVSKRVRLSLLDEDQSSFLLTSPIRGIDFIAGFVPVANWRIFPSRFIQSVLFLHEGEVLISSELGLAELLEQKFSGVVLRISFDKQVPDICGELRSVDRDWLLIGNQLVPLSAVKCIAVDNLSKLL